MREEVRDIYLLLLGMEQFTNEIKKEYPKWPRHFDEFWYRGYIIEYKNILKFLDKVYENQNP